MSDLTYTVKVWSKCFFFYSVATNLIALEQTPQSAAIDLFVTELIGISFLTVGHLCLNIGLLSANLAYEWYPVWHTAVLDMSKSTLRNQLCMLGAPNNEVLEAKNQHIQLQCGTHKSPQSGSLF